MKFEIVHLDNSQEKSNACEKITRALPDWFGIESVNQKYFKDAAELPAIGALYNNEIIALLVYKILHDDILDEKIVDVHWLGILPEFHRKKIGKQLFEKLVRIADSKEINLLTVETLDPAAKDENYFRTFKFYENLGFSIYHHFHYDLKNPMVKMKMLIPPSGLLCKPPPPSRGRK